MKYRITDDVCVCCGHTLHRIECVTAFADIEEGQKGGYIESDANLSQDGNCWVGFRSKVFGGAIVQDNAQTSGFANVFDNAQICGDSLVDTGGWVYGNSVVKDSARVTGTANVFGDSVISGTAIVSRNANADGIVISDGEYAGDDE